MTARQRAATWGRRLATLTWKELLQLSRDVPLLLFLLYSFSLSVVVSGAGITMQLTNAALLVHDADHSASSRELIHGFSLPISPLPEKSAILVRGSGNWMRVTRCYCWRFLRGFTRPS